MAHGEGMGIICGTPAKKKVCLTAVGCTFFSGSFLSQLPSLVFGVTVLPRVLLPAFYDQLMYHVSSWKTPLPERANGALDKCSRVSRVASE